MLFRGDSGAVGWDSVVAYFAAAPTSLRYQESSRCSATSLALTAATWLHLVFVVCMKKQRKENKWFSGDNSLGPYYASISSYYPIISEGISPIKITINTI